jgi:hypothetical protein
MVRTRLSAPLAALASLGFVVEGAIVVRAPQGDAHWHTSGYVVEAAFVIGLAAALPMLVELRRSSSRLAGWAVAVAHVGFGAMLVAALPSLVLGRDVLGPVFLLGVAASLVSLLALAATAVRDRGPAWWIAPLAFAGLLVGVALGDQGGGIVMGVAWLGVAVGLREAAPQPRTSFA